MGYVTLYRKWRPQTFEDVVGQEHIVRTLTNALNDSRVAHAYIFSGPRGTGKTSIAKILAKSLNCAEGPTVKPCNTCASCLEITAGTGLDVIEIDAASNRGIDEIRDIREKVKFMPAGGGTKVYIIDEVHMLTSEAFNALLKMLEEPPSHVVFILATTEPHKVLPTILSRCQRFDFRRLKTDELAGRLREIAKAEGIEVDEESVALISKQARGGMRDAVSTLDQLSSYTGNVIKAEDVMAMLGMVDTGLLFRVTDNIRDKDAAAALMFINEIVETGWDLRQFSKDLTEHFRNLFVIKNTARPADAVNATTDELAKLKGQADGFESGVLTEVIETMSVLNNEMRYASDPRLLLELAIVKMTAKKDSREQVAESREQLADSSKPEPKPETKTEPKPKPEPGQKASSWDSTVSVESQDLSRGSQIQEKSSVVKPDPLSAPCSVLPTGNELDMIKRIWPAVKDSVKKKKMSAFANLLESRPEAVENGAVVLEFNADADVHKSRIESETNRKLIEGIIRDITGKAYVIKCVLGTEIAKPEPAPAEVASSPRPISRDSRNDVMRDAPSVSRNDVTPRAVGVDLQVDTPSSEVASSEPMAPPRNDVMRNVPPAADDAKRTENIERATSSRGSDTPAVPRGTSQETEADSLAKLTGLFDAKIVETKERKDEA